MIQYYNSNYKVYDWIVDHMDSCNIRHLIRCSSEEIRESIQAEVEEILDKGGEPRSVEAGLCNIVSAIAEVVAIPIEGYLKK